MHPGSDYFHYSSVFFSFRRTIRNQKERLCLSNMIATDADARKRMGLAEKPGRHGVDDGQVGVVVNEKQPSMSAIATDVIDTRERSPEKGLIGYPDGGLRAWGVVLGAYVDTLDATSDDIKCGVRRFLTQFCGYGSVLRCHY